MIDKKKAEEILALLRRQMDLADGAYLRVTIGPVDMKGIMRFGAEQYEHLCVSSVPGELLYARESYGMDGKSSLGAHIRLSAINLHELPTAALRAKARELLGLAAAAERESNG